MDSFLMCVREYVCVHVGSTCSSMYVHKCECMYVRMSEGMYVPQCACERYVIAIPFFMLLLSHNPN